MLTKDQAVQKIAALLVDDQEINEFIRNKLEKDYPLLCVADPDEHTELLYYQARNSILMTLSNQALGSLMQIED